MPPISSGESKSTYIFAFLIECVKFEELFLLLVVVVGANEHDDENGQKDCESFNPSYNSNYNNYHRTLTEKIQAHTLVPQ